MERCDARSCLVFPVLKDPTVNEPSFTFDSNAARKTRQAFFLGIRKKRPLADSRGFERPFTSLRNMHYYQSVTRVCDAPGSRDPLLH